jgi:hypothetical protein
MLRLCGRKAKNLSESRFNKPTRNEIAGEVHLEKCEGAKI